MPSSNKKKKKTKPLGDYRRRTQNQAALSAASANSSASTGTNNDDTISLFYNVVVEAAEHAEAVRQQEEQFTLAATAAVPDSSATPSAVTAERNCVFPIPPDKENAAAVALENNHPVETTAASPSKPLKTTTTPDAAAVEMETGQMTTASLSRTTKMTPSTMKDDTSSETTPATPSKTTASSISSPPPTTMGSASMDHTPKVRNKAVRPPPVDTSMDEDLLEALGETAAAQPTPSKKKKKKKKKKKGTSTTPKSEGATDTATSPTVVDTTITSATAREEKNRKGAVATMESTSITELSSVTENAATTGSPVSECVSATGPIVLDHSTTMNQNSSADADATTKGLPSPEDSTSTITKTLTAKDSDSCATKTKTPVATEPSPKNTTETVPSAMVFSTVKSETQNEKKMEEKSAAIAGCSKVTVAPVTESLDAEWAIASSSEDAISSYSMKSMAAEVEEPVFTTQDFEEPVLSERETLEAVLEERSEEYDEGDKETADSISVETDLLTTIDAKARTTKPREMVDAESIPSKLTDTEQDDKTTILLTETNTAATNTGGTADETARITKDASTTVSDAVASTDNVTPTAVPSTTPEPNYTEFIPMLMVALGLATLVYVAVVWEPAPLPESASLNLSTTNPVVSMDPKTTVLVDNISTGDFVGGWDKPVPDIISTTASLEQPLDEHIEEPKETTPPPEEVRLRETLMKNEGQSDRGSGEENEKATTAIPIHLEDNPAQPTTFDDEESAADFEEIRAKEEGSSSNDTAEFAHVDQTLADRWQEELERVQDDLGWMEERLQHAPSKQAVVKKSLRAIVLPMHVVAKKVWEWGTTDTTRRALQDLPEKWKQFARQVRQVLSQFGQRVRVDQASLDDHAVVMAS